MTAKQRAGAPAPVIAPGPGAIIVHDGRAAVILAIAAAGYAAAPIIKMQKRRRVGDVPVGDHLVQAGRAQIVPGSPVGAEVLGNISAAELAECLRQAPRIASEGGWLRRFKPLA